MIERIARALAENADFPLESQARAVLRAMRNTTPEIDAAMRRAFERQESIWTAAIDICLKETKET